MTTRYAFKIEALSWGPGKVIFTALDEGFGFEWTPTPQIQRDSSCKKEILYVGRRFSNPVTKHSVQRGLVLSMCTIGSYVSLGSSGLVRDLRHRA
jgi:hypothetical protein